MPTVKILSTGMAYQLIVSLHIPPVVSLRKAVLLTRLGAPKTRRREDERPTPYSSSLRYR
jgi:hypothetical protein